MQPQIHASVSYGTQEHLPEIYALMQQQFPPSECYGYENMAALLEGGHYRLLRYCRQEDGALIGYAWVYVSPEIPFAWLDYLAVLPEFQAHRIGGELFTALCEEFSSTCKGMLFSVEYVCKEDAQLAKQQEARLRFYARMGARALQAEFLLPYKGGELPMYLYWKPFAGEIRITRQEQEKILADMYRDCFFFLENAKECLPRFRQTIQDEVFGGE